MEELQTKEPALPYPRIWPQQLSVAKTLALLLLLSLLIRGWVLWSTEVPARDSIGFIRYALQLETLNWQDVLKEQQQHPGYPISVMLVSWPIRFFAADTNSHIMQYSAQIASALAGWLLVIPMFFLGKHHFNRSVGFWSALLFQCFSSSGRILSDAVSDPLYLFLLITAFVVADYSMRKNSARRFALSGLLGGLAFLVRPEAALLVAATGLVLLGMQFVPSWRRSWPAFLKCGFALVLGWLLVASPYILTIRQLTPKPSARIILTQNQSESSGQDAESPPRALPLAASLFGIQINIDNDDSLRDRMLRAGWALGGEFAHTYQYIGWIPVLIGLWWCSEVYRRQPGIWVGTLLFWMHATAVWLLAAKVGYISDRHTLLLIILTIYQAVAVVQMAPFRIKQWLQASNFNWLAGWKRNSLSFGTCAFWSLVLLGVFVAAGLTKSLQPLHGHRGGHRAAGLWLSKHSLPCDSIRDDHCWAHFYAERVILELKNKSTPCPQGHKPMRFFVYSRPHKNRPPGTKRKYSENVLKKTGAKAVYHWPEDAGVHHANVVIYAIPLKQMKRIH